MGGLNKNMNASDRLRALADLAGIENGWWDFFGNYRLVSPETKKIFLKAMGFAVETDEEVAASLYEFEVRSWRRVLEPVLVWSQDNGAPKVAITLRADLVGNAFSWTVRTENGQSKIGHLYPANSPLVEEKQVDGQNYQRRLFSLPDELETGYHSFILTLEDGSSAEMELIVVPPRAYWPKEMERGERLWGISTQVYSLRSDRQWGAGDYTDLKMMCSQAAMLGASAVGINPLHALFHSQPERFSPYAPSSRLFTNTAYLDVTAIPEYAECRLAQRTVASPGFQNELYRLTNAQLIDYLAVATCKNPILEMLFDDFCAQHWDVEEGKPRTPRGEAFARFIEGGDDKLLRMGTFEALLEYFSAQNPPLTYWKFWPEEYHDPDSPDVADFREKHAHRVYFFIYLQWQADEQLKEVAKTCDDAGMPVGLYRDLGVGIAGDGVEAWSRNDVLALGVGAGAPPDPLNLKGQSWGLAPFNPIALRETAYSPFINMLRANMRHAGALRLDHAMSLQRLYWVPDMAPADQGAYVRFPVDDLFGLVALESQRNRCLVIGEDLGTVPDGFRERMLQSGILSYRVLLFARFQNQHFLGPDDIEAQSLVTVGTHDLPSLVAWWQGKDLDEKERLDLYPSAEMAQKERSDRGRDRNLMADALSWHGCVPKDFPRTPDLDEGQMRVLIEGAYSYIQRSPAKLMMMQIEDALGLSLQMNMPGTVMQHPNWRYRLPLQVDETASNERILTLARHFVKDHCPSPWRESLTLVKPE